MKFYLVPFILIFCIGANASPHYVNTVAGAYVGDGGAASSAAFAFPQYAAADGLGNVYIADQYHCRIRRVNSLGNISTIAGTGICGFTGDGGFATKANIYWPAGIAVDSRGNIFFADAVNARVRVINSSGKITTVAGGTYGYCGDGGPAKQACLNLPTALALAEEKSGETLYIADTHNNRVRMVNLVTGIITTAAGNGIRGYSGDGGAAIDASLDTPQGLAVNASSHTLWISDTSNSAIRSVETNTGIIGTFFGNGICGITLCFPQGIALDSNGNLYVSAVGNGIVIEVQVPSGIAITKAGNGGQGFSGDGGLAVSASLNVAQDVVLDSSGNLFIVDSLNDRVRKVDASGTISTIAGGDVGDGGKSNASAVNWAQGLAFDNTGNLYIADTWNNRIRVVNPAGVISTIAGTGVSGYSGDGGTASQAQLSEPVSVTTDGQGNIYVADYGNFAIRKISATGIISTFASNAFLNAIASDASGNIYGSNSVSCVIQKFSASGQSSVVAGTEFQCGYNGDGIPATQAKIFFPEGLAVDSQGNLFFSDMGNYRVRKIDAFGTISTVVGNGNCSFSGDGGPASQATICGADGVGVDPSGNLFIADSYNGRIRVVNSALTINTYAGHGGGGYNGNGLTALKTDMEPFPLAIDPEGFVYFGDILSYLIRKID